MTTYRYIFDRSGKKHLCPKCEQKRFVRYVDNETRQYLPEKYGRCDRESNCGHHLNPYADRYTSGESNVTSYTRYTDPKPSPVYFMPESVLNATLKDYDKNTFIKNLLKLCPPAEVEKVVSLYRLGTIGKGDRLGAVTFPFIDKTGNIRTIQAKQFDETNHTQSTDFVHAIVARYHANKNQPLPQWLQDYKKNERFVSCLFGEHLLDKYPHNPVALVEAPKTAIIGTLYYGLPESPVSLLWLAVYNKSSLSLEKCKALQGRNIVLFPDLNAFNDWNTKAKALKAKMPGTCLVVSGLLEQNATDAERTNGLDLADYLTGFDYKLFRKQHPVPVQETMMDPEPDTISALGCAKSENSADETKHIFSTVIDMFSESFYPVKIGINSQFAFQSDDAQPITFQEQQTKKPLRPATGKLKDLEDTFIRTTQQRKKHPVDYTKIISLFDRYKRDYPSEEQLTELQKILDT